MRAYEGTVLITSISDVVTDRPQRYLKQLVGHFSSKLRTESADDFASASVFFDAGEVALIAGDASLGLTARSADSDGIERLESVVGSHLVRFGSKDELVVSWIRSDGTAGTSWVGGSEYSHERGDSAR